MASRDRGSARCAGRTLRGILSWITTGGSILERNPFSVMFAEQGLLQSDGWMDEQKKRMSFLRFNQKQNLHTHVRHVHLGERRYSCTECGAKFRRKRLLDCHVNSKHKGEKPYSCSLCPATFVYPEHVKKHEQTHRYQF